MRERPLERLRERAVGRVQRAYVTGALGTQTFELQLHDTLTAESSNRLRRVMRDLAPPSFLERCQAWLAGRDERALSSGLLAGLVSEHPAVIGRSRSCDMVVTDTSVSRRHALLTRDGGIITVTDLGSTNGTLVNGRRVTQAEVRAGDRLQLGALRLLL